MTPVLSVASECYPLVKTGGLADVVGALPAALAPHGFATSTLIPAIRRSPILSGPARWCITGRTCWGSRRGWSNRGWATTRC